MLDDACTHRIWGDYHYNNDPRHIGVHGPEVLKAVVVFPEDGLNLRLVFFSGAGRRPYAIKAKGISTECENQGRGLPMVRG
jgi:hypothetical protein